MQLMWLFSKYVLELIINSSLMIVGVNWSFWNGDALLASELHCLNKALMQRLLTLDVIEAIYEAKILRKTQVSCHVLITITFLMFGSKVVEKRTGLALPFLVDM